MNELYIIEDSVLVALTEEGRRQNTFVLPEGITAFMEGIFNNISVTEIVFPSSLKYIPSGILANHGELKRVTVSRGTEKIMEFAFHKCTSLEEISIPDSVDGIEMYAFNSCTSLKRINLPDSIKTIGMGAFEGCTSLERIKIPANVEELKDYTFSGCKTLWGVVLPEKLRLICNEAFDGCINLCSLTIPHNVVRVEKHAFLRCFRLANICVNQDVSGLLDGVRLPGNCTVHWRKYMDADEAERAYIEVCRYRFPLFVENITDYCSVGADGENDFRTKEEILSFALKLLTDFGPYPSQSEVTREAWNRAFDEWNASCPPHPELSACGTASMSGEDIRQWYVDNRQSPIDKLW